MQPIPIPLRNELRRAWLAAMNVTPLHRRCKGTLHEGSRFCATGIFAELCVQNVDLFVWEDVTAMEAEEEMSDDEPIYAIRRKGSGGLDVRGLPDEMLWMLGLTDRQEGAITEMNDNDIPFIELTHRVGRWFGIEPTVQTTSVSWGLVRSLLPQRNRNPARDRSLFLPEMVVSGNAHSPSHDHPVCSLHR